MLFVELALIRWTAAYDIHLAYLTNFVLLASFLGIGIGFLRVRKDPSLLPFHPVRRPERLLVAVLQGDRHAAADEVGGITAHDTLTISANNIPHQTAYRVDELLHLQPFYAFPYRHFDGPPERVLVIGAGN